MDRAFHSRSRVTCAFSHFEWSGEGEVTVHEVVPKKKTSGGSDFCLVKGANALANHESNNEVIND